VQKAVGRYLTRHTNSHLKQTYTKPYTTIGVK